MLINFKRTHPNLLFMLTQVPAFVGWAILLKTYPLATSLARPRLLNLPEFFIAYPASFQMVLTATVVLIFTAFILGWRVVRTARLKPIILIVTLLGFVSILLFIFPLDALDVFANVWYERIFSFYGLNPFITVVQGQMRLDPWYRLAPGWMGGLQIPYGPIWFYLGLLPSFIFQKTPLGAIISLKVVTAIFFLLTLLPLHHLFRSKEDSKSFWLKVYLLFLNPVFLVSFVNSGHIDSIMVFFMSCSLYFLHQKKLIWFVVSFILAALTKYGVFLTLPLFLIYIWQQPALFKKKLITMAQVVGVMLTLGVLIFLPIWQGFPTLKGLLIQLTHWGFAPITVLQYALRGVLGVKSLQVPVLGVGVFVLGYLTLLIDGARNRLSFERLLGYSFLAILLYFYFVSEVLSQWYLFWLVPLAWLWTKETAYIITAASLAFLLLPIIAYSLARSVNDQTFMMVVLSLGILVIYILPALVLMFSRLRDQRFKFNLKTRVGL